MTVFRYRGRLYEVTGSSPIDMEGYHYECWDLTQDSGGQLGRIVVPETGMLADNEILVHLVRPVSAQVLLRWMYFVPELQHHAVPPDRDAD